MANPNLVNVTSITGESVQATLDTTLTTEILAAASDTLVKINSIIVANIDGSSAADASVFITKSGGSPIAIASTISVPADATLVVVDKNTALYLEEGDNLEAGASANGDLTITVNFEILNDA
jgi:poly-gamma-glutamate capsule biosynthesis protein CapA/YwtB (metallophosphatase superfamily)|tara:strand:+ start:194 stop:559 length:366 start_codon:yes stop_codon:yes gene_type:complete